MKKQDYDAKLKRAEGHLLAKQYVKALSEFLALNKYDKPFGIKLGLPDQIEKLYGLIKDQEFAIIRGLGVIVLEALNKKNQFQEIYRIPITKQVDKEGNDIHPLRLPAILRTRFVKAESEEWLQKQLDLFKGGDDKKDINEDLVISDLGLKIKERDNVIEKLGEDLKECKESGNDLYTAAQDLSEKNKLLEKEIKDLNESDTELRHIIKENSPEELIEAKEKIEELEDEIIELGETHAESSKKLLDGIEELEKKIKELEKKKPAPKKVSEAKL